MGELVKVYVVLDTQFPRTMVDSIWDDSDMARVRRRELIATAPKMEPKRHVPIMVLTMNLKNGCTGYIEEE